METEGSKNWTVKASPRAWQTEALEIWRKNQHGVVRVVTGAGKTLFAEMCMLAFREGNPEGRFIILVPTTALLDQWYVSLQEDLGVSQEEIACFSGEERNSRPSVVNLIVINTGRKVAPVIAAQFDTCLIVDECHRTGSPVNSLALTGPHQATLGLSATPEREYDEGFESRIAPALGEVLYTYDYVRAFEDKVISPFEMHNIRVDFLPDELEKYEDLSRQIAREAKKLVDLSKPSDRMKWLLRRRAAVSASATMRIPVAAKILEQHRGRRTIVFHERIEKADALREVLSYRGHRVTVYHSGVGPTLRRDNLRLYRKGLFDVLISCRALDEGMNVPETQVAVIASSTSSLRQRIQRLGRVLRPAQGKTVATIYTIYATDQEERRLLAESQKLSGIAPTTWQKGGLHKGGSVPH